ncbi:hypothetical protein TWF217_003883 [Orbilia oligospora]|nr:hypothetical protein TWF217_003883 [Orbilia oligospora]
MAAPRRDKLSFLLLSLILFLSFFDTTFSIRFHDTSIITKWKWKKSTSISIKYSYRAIQISTITSADTELCKGYPIPTTFQHALAIKVCEKCPIQTITNVRDPITSHAEPWVYGRTTIFQWWVIEFWEWAFRSFQTAVYHVSQHGKSRKWTSYTIGITLKARPMTILGVLTTYNTTIFIPHRTRVTVHNLEGEYRSTIQVTRAPTTIKYMKTTKFHTTVYISVTQVVQLTEVNTIMDGSGSIIKITSLLPLPSSIKIRCATKSTHINREGSTLILMSDIITSIPLAINVPGCTRVYASTSCASPKSAGGQGGPGDEIDSLSSDLEEVADSLTSASLQLSTVSRPISSLASGISPRPSSSEKFTTASGSTAIAISISASNPSVLQSAMPLSVSSNSDSLSTITSAVVSWYEMVTQTIYSGSTSRTSLTIGADGNPTAIIVLPTGLGGIRFTTVSSGSTVSETAVVGPDGATTIFGIRPITSSQAESRSVGLAASSVSSTDPVGQSSVEFLSTKTSSLEATDLISTTGILLITSTAPTKTVFKTQSFSTTITSGISILPTIIYITTINSATASTTLTSGNTVSTFISVVTSSVMSNLRSTVSTNAPATITTFTSLSYIAVTVTSRIVIPPLLETFGTDILSEACVSEVTPKDSVETVSAIIFETVTLIQTTSIVSTTRTEFSTIIESQTSTEIVNMIVPETSYTSTIFFTKSINSLTTVTTYLSTSTSTIAQIATTTIKVAQGAPSGTVSYLNIGGINNGTFTISDDAMHLTNNFYAPNTRETFIVTNLGQLYSVANNYYYGDPTAADNKLFWGFTNQTASRNYYIAFTSSTNAYQLYVRSSTVCILFGYSK